MLRWFPKITRHLDRLLVWITFFGVLWAAMSWLSKQMSTFGILGWPEAIFLGLASLCILILVLSAALIAWRFFRPLPTSKQSVPILDSVDVRLLDGANENIDTVSARLAQSIDERRDFQEKMESWMTQFRDKVECRFGWVDQGFAAILDRERLLNLAASIIERGESLSGPTRGEQLENWDDWQIQETQWRTDIQEWAKLADIYRNGAWGRIFQTPERDYRGKWKATDDLFPDAEAIYVYRTFRIILRNFRKEQSSVENNVRLAAFAGPSLKGRGKVPRDENQMPLPPEA